MAKALRKKLANLERRRKEHDKTALRQKQGRFPPNLSGGIHEIHRPGGMK